MLTRNIATGQGLTNGAFGIVKAIIYGINQKPPALPEFVVVQFDDYRGTTCIPDVPRCVATKPVTQTWMSSNGSCSRTQFPLTLGWALTIHKCQGLTLSKVWIDTERATFASEMLYVALSRVKRLQDLIIGPFELDYVNRKKKNDVYHLRLLEEKRLKSLHKQTIENWNLNTAFLSEKEPIDIDEFDL